jgi:Plant transposon protein
MIAPLKDPIMHKELRWSKWVESMQKYVECTLGILKCRFRVLKTGVRVHCLEAADNLWCTCCALQNMFLNADGLDDAWDGELGNHSVKDTIQYLDNEEINYDTSSFGYGSDFIKDGFNTRIDSVDEFVDPENEEVVDADIDTEKDTNADNVDANIISVNSCSHAMFCEKVINHFDIMFQNNEVKRPTRSGPQEASTKK